MAATKTKTTKTKTKTKTTKNQKSETTSDEKRPDPPNHDEIGERAFQIAQRRGGNLEALVDDWLQAERELRRERGLPVDG
jgi:ABC-type phosphonate transport system ATPase subunit